MRVGAAGQGAAGARAIAAGDAAAPVPNVLAGILFVTLSAGLFAVMNTLAKLATLDFELPQVVWARTLGHLIFVLAIFAPRHGLTLIRPRRLADQLARSVCLLASTLLFFGGLSLSPLAEGTTISFVAPLLVVLLAWLMLGERIRPACWAGVALGLAGVAIVLRPGAAGFHWPLLLFAASALFNAVYQVLTRRVAGHDTPETSVVYSALVGALVMSAAVPFFWTAPSGLLAVAHLGVLGILGGTGHYCLARAFTWAPASIVTPFNYLQLVGASLLGYLVFDQLPTAWTWLGALLIVVAGLLIVADEMRRRRAASAVRAA